MQPMTKEIHLKSREAVIKKQTKKKSELSEDT